MKIKSIILASLLATITYNSAMAVDYPITVVDDRNVAVTFTEKPKNVAALSVVGADVMKAIGENPIGVGTFGGAMPLYLGYDAKDYVDFGVLNQPNMELMTEQKVDLTVGITNYNAPFAEDFEKLGNLLTFDTMNFEDSFRATLTLAKVFGKGDEAKSLNEDFIELIDNYREKTKPGQSAIFIWVYGDVNYAYYDESILGSLFNLMNVKNVMGSNINALLDKHDIATVIDAEELLELDPDAIFIFRFEGNKHKNNPIYRKLKAVKNNRVYHVGAQYSEPHGPIAREMVFKEMAHIMYPDTFEMPKMPEAAKAVPVVFVD